ncbi:MAG: class I SAM-dependent methyltransferase [Oscillospiraceae bacterium]|nr:class I SAM-dependent methyltransferase [Oscillospiraceae bacterium]
MQKYDNIDGGAAFDWGRSSVDYAKYRDIYPAEFYQRILDLGLCVSGQTVLDLGTGTGVLPRNLYPHGAKFAGADISKEQIDQARALSDARNMDIDYIVAAAEDVDFPAGSFDVVTASQCHIYFDNKRVYPKIYQLLKDGGHFCILWTIWLSFEDEIARRSEELVLKYNPGWTGAGIKRAETAPCLDEEAAPYFEEEHSLSYDVNIPFTRESWHGRIVACRGMGASSLPRETIRDFEAEHKAFLRTVPEEFEILHNVSLLNLRKKG